MTSAAESSGRSLTSAQAGEASVSAGREAQGAADAVRDAHRREASAVAPAAGAADAYRVTLTLTPAAYAALMEAQALTRQRHPDGDLNAVVGAALEAFVRQHKARKFGLKQPSAAAEPARGTKRATGTRAPQAQVLQASDDTPTTAIAVELENAPTDVGAGKDRCDEAQRADLVAGRSRYIPRAVRREVYVRDAGCCTYTAADGARCRQTELLEFDHVTPFACGGSHTVGNLRLRCRAHNALEAELAFGKQWQKQRVAGVVAERQSVMAF